MIKSLACSVVIANCQKHCSTTNAIKHGGVDRGTMILLQHNITPIFAVGDFDSISESEREWVQSRIAIEPVPAEKPIQT